MRLRKLVNLRAKGGMRVASVSRTTLDQEGWGGRKALPFMMRVRSKRMQLSLSDRVWLRKEKEKRTAPALPKPGDA